MRKKLRSFLTAIAVTAATLPCIPSAGVKAADEYKIRDKWGYCKTANYVESEHFVIFYGNNDTTGQVNDAFLKRNLEDYEKLWKCYGEYLGMENMNVDIYGKSDQKYKTNVYLTYTGLDKYPDGWAFMSAEDGYGIEIISPEAMLDDLTIAHEFGHVITMQQKAWVDQEITGAWWEPLANWFREMYIGSEYYTGDVKTCWFEPYIRNMSLTLPHGRNYYEVWPFLVYLSYNPDNIEGLGIDAVKRIISEAKPDEYPFDTITRLFGTDAQTIFGHYAKRMATFAIGPAQNAYKEEFSKKLAQSPYYWNLFYTVLENNGSEWLQVPQEEAPMQAGINIIPLNITGDTISAELRGISDDSNAGWQACIVTVDSSGKETYSDLFCSGQKMSISAKGAVSAYLTVTAMPKKLVRVNAFHKDKESTYKDGAERRRYPYEVRLDGADVQQSGGYSKGKGHIHPNGGGWVADSAKVADSVYVGPNAMILGRAELTENVRVEDYAVVANSVFGNGNAIVSGHAVVDGGGWVYTANGWEQGSVKIGEKAVISDSAVVTNSCNIKGAVKVIQKAYLADAVKLGDLAVAKGMSYLYGSNICGGFAVLDGDYCNDKKITEGVNFGWLDDNGQHDIPDWYIAEYDFDNESSYWMADKYTATNARQLGAEWSAERTSAKGVMNFDGKDDYLLLDTSLLKSDDIQLGMGVLRKGSGQQELFRFGDENAYAVFTPSNENGVAELTLTAGKTTEKLTASSALPEGEWSRITIRIIKGKGTLLINGKQADSKELTLDMKKILSASENDLAVIGKGFNGAVDYIQISSGEVDEPAVSYSGKEEPDSSERIKGDVNADKVFNIADLAAMQRYLLNKPDSGVTDWKAGDLCEDNILDVFDLIIMRKLILNK